MSDIALNATRYDDKNTKRSDAPNPHNGEVVGDGIGFDCSGFICHVIIESGYIIDYEPTSTLSTSNAFTTVNVEDVCPGDIILFDGHVGIVIEYNNSRAFGKFIHMSGRNNMGKIRRDDFITSQETYRRVSAQIGDVPLKGPDGKIIKHGVFVPIELFRRVNSNRYSQELDKHINGSNANPVLSPLGTRVYSQHKLRAAKEKNKVAEKTKPLPSPNPLQTRPAPDWVGYSAVLLKRAWGRLTEGDLADYE